MNTLDHTFCPPGWCAPWVVFDDIAVAVAERDCS